MCTIRMKYKTCRVCGLQYEKSKEFHHNLTNRHLAKSRIWQNERIRT